MATADDILVEVVVSTADRQALCSLRLAAGADAAGAVKQADLQSKFPDIEWGTCELAIWGRPVPGYQVLEDGDRVEVLRPLRLDPRDARRALAKDGRVMGVSRPTGD